MKSTTQKHHKGFILAVCIVSLTVISIITTAVLLSISVQNSALKLERSLTDTGYQVSQIGEYFISGTLSEDDIPEGYSFTIDETGNILTVKKGGTTVLLIEKNTDDPENVKIVRWHAFGAAESVSTEGLPEL